MTSAVVRAAQAGDERALDALIREHLPLIYNIAGRALDRHADTDDVVQQILLDVLRDLPDLRDPSRLRSWLVVITLREVNTFLARRARSAARTVPLDDAAGLPGASFEDLAILRLGLTGQRREVALAGRWLDPDDRQVLALWSQEVAGRLTRAEVTAALGLTPTHTGVRVHRMREQLEIARGVEAALALSPRCPGLHFPGVPGPLWRKRLARHIRECARCTAASSGRFPTERLLAGLGLVAVPPTLGVLPYLRFDGASDMDVTGFPRPDPAGISARMLAGTAAAATITAVLVAVLITAGPDEAPPDSSAFAQPSPAQPSSFVPPSAAAPPTAAPRSPAPTALPLTGALSLESAGKPGHFLATGPTSATLQRTTTTSTAAARKRATLTAEPGLADDDCISLRDDDGRYLRHFAFRLRFDGADAGELFRKDATFCPDGAGRVVLASLNYPSRTITHRSKGELGIDPGDGPAATWIVREPLAR